jgi:hypothetical protein
VESPKSTPRRNRGRHSSISGDFRCALTDLNCASRSLCGLPQLHLFIWGDGERIGAIGGANLSSGKNSEGDGWA